MMISLRGLKYWRHFFRGVNYGVSIIHKRGTKEHRFSRSMNWLHIWTPVWHKGRGPYITIGLFGIAFYRGY
jgi:hypothetical protein